MYGSLDPNRWSTTLAAGASAQPVIDGARDRWARQKPPWLELLADQVAERHRAYGDVGFLLEPDLKESHGGLRDVNALSAADRRGFSCACAFTRQRKAITLLLPFADRVSFGVGCGRLAPEAL